MLGNHDAAPVTPPARDRVDGLGATNPKIVSISDIHGYLGDAQSALLAVGDHPDFEPMVEADAARRLQWVGGEEYVLVFNGDLVDRGANNDRVVRMVERLIDQAPPGHVRVTLGNHEMGVMTPDRFGWTDWYSCTRSDEERRAFLRQVIDGHVVAAYEGYNVTYAHAGRRQPYDAHDRNEELVAAAETLLPAVGSADDFDVQNEVIREYHEVLGLDGRTGRGRKAGIAWVDFEFMPEDAPPQVIGHTRHRAPTREGAVICQNVIRDNRRREGGEAVVVETPERILALGRDHEGGVRTHEFDLPVEKQPEA